MVVPNWWTTHTNGQLTQSSDPIHCQLDAIGSFNIPSKFLGKVLEGFIQVIAALCRNLIVLQFLLHVERNLFGFHLPPLQIHLVSTDYNGNVATYPATISQLIAGSRQLTH